MYKYRLITSRLGHLVETFPVVVISGAHQVGKSTLLKNVFPEDTDCVVFDPVVDVENARNDPDLFLDYHPRKPLLLDEIQYAPELVASIKRRVDRERMPGRVVFIDLEPFCVAELANRDVDGSWLAAWLENPHEFVSAKHQYIPLQNTLYETLWRGFLPDATTIPIDVVADFHNAYLKTYIDRDVRLLADVSEWQTFGRFVKLAAALTAQEINYSQLGREIGFSPQTSRRWLDMLKATFQWYEAPAYSGNLIKRVSNKPKGFIADIGFACAAQLISSPIALGGQPMLGALFETAVMAEIRKLSSSISPKPQIYHWRSAGGAEVDLLLERDGKLFPIEVKVKSRLSRQDARGIKAFRDSYPELDVQPGLVIAPTDKFLKISDNDYALPWNVAPR